MGDILDVIEYSLGVSPYSLSEAERNMVYVCKMLVDYNLSLRQCEKEYGVSKSVLYRFIYKDLPYISDYLYGEVKSKLNSHTESRYCVLRRLEENRKRGW